MNNIDVVQDYPVINKPIKDYITYTKRFLNISNTHVLYNKTVKIFNKYRIYYQNGLAYRITPEMIVY